MISTENSKNWKNDARRPQKLENRAPGWAKMSPRAPKNEFKDAKREPKGTNSYPKGKQSEPKRNPKWANIYIKSIFDITEKVLNNVVFWEAPVQHDHSFLTPFSRNVRRKIDAKIDPEKVMKNDEQTMRKWSGHFIFVEKCVYKKSFCSIKVNVRKPYVSPSRMRVAEGLSKKRKSAK